MQVRCPAHVYAYVMLTYVLVTIRFAHEQPECDTGLRERVMDTCNLYKCVDPDVDARGSALVDMI